MTLSTKHMRCLAVVMLIATARFANADASLARPESKEPTVAEVAALIDSWSGQGEILEAAKQKIDAILAADPRNYEALRERARYEIRRGYQHSGTGDYRGHRYPVGIYSPGALDRAEAALREALQINPKYAGAYVLLGHIYSEEEKPDGAAVALAEAEKIGTDDPWLHLNWADVLVARGEDEAAGVRMQRVLDSGTTQVKALLSAYRFLADHYAKTGEPEKMVAMYEKQLELEPQNAWNHGNYASALSAIGRYDEAISQSKVALSIMDYGMGHRVLADALYRKWADMVDKDPRSRAKAEPHYVEAAQILPPQIEMAEEAGKPGAEALARALVRLKKVPVNAVTENGVTALHYAAYLGNRDGVRLLLALGANPNARTDDGSTPLLAAAMSNDTATVELLLAKGVDRTATNPAGYDASGVARQNGNEELARLIRTYGIRKKKPG